LRRLQGVLLLAAAVAALALAGAQGAAADHLVLRDADGVRVVQGPHGRQIEITVVDEREVARIAVTDLDRDVAEVAFSLLRDPKLIAGVARRSRHPAVRVEALMATRDEKLAAQVLATDRDEQVRAAAARLSGASREIEAAAATATASAPAAAMAPRLRVEFARTGPDSADAWDVVAAITDRSVLARLARTAAGPGTRFAAAAALRDERLLVDAARQAGRSTTPLAVIWRLKDQRQLAAVARMGRGLTNVYPGAVPPARVLRRRGEAPYVQREPMLAGLRLAAIRRLDERAALTELVEHDPDPGIRLAAVERIADPPALAAIAAATDDHKVREVAVAHLKDQGILQRLARTAPRKETRILAIGRIGGRVLADIARRAADVETALAAVARLDDEALLGEISALSLPDAVRDAAFARAERLAAARQSAEDATLLGPALTQGDAGLFGIATADPVAAMRAAAARNLTEQELLFKVARGDPEAAVRASAAGALTDPALLAKIVADDADPAVRAAAVSRMTDQKALAAIAANDPEERVRRTARRNLRPAPNPSRPPP
jgi:hypothetical protein